MKPYLICRKVGHDYGDGPGVLPRVDFSQNSVHHCTVCGATRQIINGELTYLPGWDSDEDTPADPEHPDHDDYENWIMGRDS